MMINSRRQLLSNINTEKLKKGINVKKSAVTASKKKMKEDLENPPDEYIEKNKDEDKDTLIAQMYFFETQVVYLENLVDTLQKEVSEYRQKLESD